VKPSSYHLISNEDGGSNLVRDLFNAANRLFDKLTSLSANLHDTLDRYVNTDFTRRDFLEGTRDALILASAFEVVGAITGCAGVQTTQGNDTLTAIRAIMNKEPNDPADVKRLEAILLPWAGERNIEIVVEAARALALHADFFVIPIYTQLFKLWHNNSSFVRYFTSFLAFNFTVNPASRLKILYFMYRIAVQLAPKVHPADKIKHEYLPDWAKAQANAATGFWGNVGLRGWYIKLRNAQLAVHRNPTSINTFLEYIQAIEPSFIAQTFTSEDKDSLKTQMASGNDKDKISALRKLHETTFVDAQLLLSMLKNASYELEEAIIPLIGNNLAFTPEIEDIMLNYLDGNNNNLGSSGLSVLLTPC